jgi:serine protease Do
MEKVKIWLQPGERMWNLADIARRPMVRYNWQRRAGSAVWDESVLSVNLTKLISRGGSGGQRCNSPAGSGCVTRVLWVAWAAALSSLSLLGVPMSSKSAEADVRRDAAVSAIEQVIPSVVNIATETVIEYHDWYDELLRQFYGRSRSPLHQQKNISLGSGVIVDEDGYVLTNFHVVHRANRIQVKLWDGREYDADPLILTETSDIAVLKIRAKPGEKFKTIRFAPDDDLLLGETVLALGNPFGLGGSVTKGILSSKNRRPATGNEPLNVEDWLQTDAAINPGNSGGPLVNLRGELIGLNVAVYREGNGGERGMGVGFSIPVKQITAALSRYFTPEMTESLWFGAQFKCEAGRWVLADVQPGSPAAKAKLSTGDKLVEINGQTPRSLIATTRLLTTDPDHKAILVVERGSKRESVTVQLTSIESLVRQKLGLTLLEITPQTAQKLGVRPGEALYVDGVEKNSPAEKADLQRGFLLAAIDGQNVTSLRAVAEALAGRKKGDPARLTLVVPRRLGNSFMQYRQGTIDLELR